LSSRSRQLCRVVVFGAAPAPPASSSHRRAGAFRAQVFSGVDVAQAGASGGWVAIGGVDYNATWFDNFSVAGATAACGAGFSSAVLPGQ
jgi:hypothetical protein